MRTRERGLFDQLGGENEGRGEKKELDGKNRLSRFLSGLAEYVKSEMGLDILDRTGRLKEISFKDVYSEDEIGEDISEIWRLKKSFCNGNEVRALSYEPSGAEFEKIKTVIFNKKLGSDFLVVRSSEYDDIKNGVDNIILDRKTGNIVCAFDEYEGGEHGNVYDGKKVLSENTNLKGGASVKYGAMFKPDKNSEMQLVRGKIENIPKFLMVCTEEDVKKAIDSLDMSSPGKTSVQEEIIYYQIIASLERQIEENTRYVKMAKNPILQERFDIFAETLKNLKQIKQKKR